MNTVTRLKQLLEERNLSLYKFAETYDFNYSSLRAAETRNSQLSIDTIERVCKCLNITLAEFFTVPGEGEPESVIADGPLTKEEIAILRKMISDYNNR